MNFDEAQEIAFSIEYYKDIKWILLNEIKEKRKEIEKYNKEIAENEYKLKQFEKSLPYGEMMQRDATGRLYILKFDKNSPTEAGQKEIQCKKSTDQKKNIPKQSKKQ